MNTFVELGYIGLFIIAFLAATILPFSSEVVLTSLLLNDYSPVVLLLIATIGNVLGSIVNYLLGYWASLDLIKKWLKISDQEFIKAEQRFKTYGVLALCFAWVPIIGDPLTVMAGILRLPFRWFLLLVSIGKFARYLVIIILTYHVT